MSSKWYNSNIRCASALILERARCSERIRGGHRFRGGARIVFAAYWLDRRSVVPEQYVAVGWVGDRIFAVIFEIPEGEEGEITPLVTLWRSTKEEIRVYEENH